MLGAFDQNPVKNLIPIAICISCCAKMGTEKRQRMESMVLQSVGCWAKLFVVCAAYIPVFMNVAWTSCDRHIISVAQSFVFTKLIMYEIFFCLYYLNSKRISKMRSKCIQKNASAFHVQSKKRKCIVSSAFKVHSKEICSENWWKVQTMVQRKPICNDVRTKLQVCSGRTFGWIGWRQLPQFSHRCSFLVKSIHLCIKSAFDIGSF